MKSRMIKLAACLLVSTMMITGGAASAFATEADANSTEQTVAAAGPASGVSLLLAETNSQYLAQSEAQGTADVQAAAEAGQQAGDTAQRASSQENAEEDQYADMGVVQADGYVNIRSKASTDAKIVGKIKNKAVATVVKEKDGWYKIKSGSVTGYIKAEFLTVGNQELIESVSYRVAKVKTETLKVRKKASADAPVVTLVGSEDKLKVIKEDDSGWVKVKTSDGKGYVSAEYVKVKDAYNYAEEIKEESDDSGSSSSTGSGGGSVASYALQFTGNPYVWGGTSLTNGADCSGFVMSVYAHFGVSLPHSSGAQRGVGRGVSYSEAQPGDIICYSGHVGIYIGGGQIVHASNPSDGIKVSSATYKTILAVRRIF